MSFKTPRSVWNKDRKKRQGEKSFRRVRKTGGIKKEKKLSGNKGEWKSNGARKEGRKEKQKSRLKQGRHFVDISRMIRGNRSSLC